MRGQNIFCWKLDGGCHFGSYAPIYIFDFIFLLFLNNFFYSLIYSIFLFIVIFLFGSIFFIFLCSMFLLGLFWVGCHFYRLYNICVIIVYVGIKCSVILLSLYKNCYLNYTLDILVKTWKPCYKWFEFFKIILSINL